MKKILVLVLFCSIFVLGCNNQQEKKAVEEVSVDEIVTEVDNGEDQENKQQEQTDNESIINDFILKGRNFLNDGKFKEAIEAYTKAIELDRNQEILYAERGRAKRDAGDLDGAIEDMSRALELHAVWIHIDRGQIYKEKGEKALAIQDYKKALELAPDLKFLEEEIRELESK